MLLIFLFPAFLEFFSVENNFHLIARRDCLAFIRISDDALIERLGCSVHVPKRNVTKSKLVMPALLDTSSFNSTCVTPINGRKGSVEFVRTMSPAWEDSVLPSEREVLSTDGQDDQSLTMFKFKVCRKQNLSAKMLFRRLLLLTFGYLSASVRTNFPTPRPKSAHRSGKWPTWKSFWLVWRNLLDCLNMTRRVSILWALPRNMQVSFINYDAHEWCVLCSLLINDNWSIFVVYRTNWQ